MDFESNFKETKVEFAYETGLSEYDIERKIDTFSSKISFEMLDDYYDNGLSGTFNEVKDKPYAYDLFALVVGYKMLTRYGLSFEEYENWAQKQDVAYKYTLLKLIGKGTEEEKKQGKVAVSSVQDEESIKSFEDYLKSHKYRWIIRDVDGKYDLFDGKVSVNSETKTIIRLVKAVSPCSDFSFKLFDEDFKEKCADYISFTRNIQSVFDEACSAYWSRYRRIIVELGFQDKLEKLSELYKDRCNEKVSSVLYGVFSDMKRIAERSEGKKEEVYNSSREAEAGTTFWGGGFGIGGAIKGMITASVLNGLNQGLIHSVESFQNSRIETQMETDLINASINEYRIEEYKEALSEVYKDYLIILVKETIGIDIYLPEESELLEIIRTLPDSIDSDMLYSIAFNLLAAFPLNKVVYDFVLSHFANVRNQLLLLAKEFEMVEYVEKNTTGFVIDKVDKVVAIDSKSDVFLDQNIASLKAYSKEELNERISFIVRFKLLIYLSKYRSYAVNKYITNYMPRAIDKVRREELDPNDNLDEMVCDDGGVDYIGEEKGKKIKEIKEELLCDTSNYILFDYNNTWGEGIVVTDRYLIIIDDKDCFSIPIKDYSLGMQILESDLSEKKYYTINFGKTSISTEFFDSGLDVLLFVLNSIAVVLRGKQTIDEYLQTQVSKKQYYYYPESKKIGTFHNDKVWETDYVVLKEEGFVDRYNKYLDIILSNKIPDIYNSEKKICVALNVDYEGLFKSEVNYITEDDINRISKSTTYYEFVYRIVLSYFLSLGFRKYYPEHIVNKYVWEATNKKYSFLYDDTSGKNIKLEDTEYVVYDDESIIISDRHIYINSLRQLFDTKNIIEAFATYENLELNSNDNYLELLADINRKNMRGFSFKALKKPKENISVQLYVFSSAKEATEILMNSGERIFSRHYHYANSSNPRDDNSIPWLCLNTNHFNKPGLTDKDFCPWCNERLVPFVGNYKHTKVYPLGKSDVVECLDYLKSVAARMDINVLIASALKNDDKNGGFLLKVFELLAAKELEKEKNEKKKLEEKRLAEERRLAEEKEVLKRKEEEKASYIESIKVSIGDNRVETDNIYNSNLGEVARFRKILRILVRNDRVARDVDYDPEVLSQIMKVNKDYRVRGDVVIKIFPNFFITDSGIFAENDCWYTQDIVDVTCFTQVGSPKGLLLIRSRSQTDHIETILNDDEQTFLLRYMVALMVFRSNMSLADLNGNDSHLYYCPECKTLIGKNSYLFASLNCPTCKKMKKKTELFVCFNNQRKEKIQAELGYYDAKKFSISSYDYDDNRWLDSVKLFYENAQTKKCIQCGRILPKNASFCAKCGGKV